MSSEIIKIGAAVLMTAVAYKAYSSLSPDHQTRVKAASLCTALLGTALYVGRNDTVNRSVEVIAALPSLYATYKVAGLLEVVKTVANGIQENSFVHEVALLAGIAATSSAYYAFNKLSGENRIKNLKIAANLLIGGTGCALLAICINKIASQGLELAVEGFGLEIFFNAPYVWKIIRPIGPLSSFAIAGIPYMLMCITSGLALSYSAINGLCRNQLLGHPY